MKICVPIQESTQKAVQKRLNEVKKEADIAEVWLDQIRDLAIETLFSKKVLPIAAVCKRLVEKGRFRGGFEALSDVLKEAIHCGADYIDIPLDMPEIMNKKIVQKAREKSCKVIVSHHDFKATPDYSGLVKLADRIKKRGADIVKIATHAKDLQDTVNMIALARYLQDLETRHILIAMGQKGILSRILTPTLDGEMMFATLGKTGQTAPGQLTVKELRHAWELITL